MGMDGVLLDLCGPPQEPAQVWDSHPGVGANCPLSCCRSFFSTLGTRFTHMSGNSIVQLWKLLTEVEEE